MLTTIERPVEKKAVDPSKFDKTLYFHCVKNAAGMTTAALSELVDEMLSDVLAHGVENVSEIILEQVSIFAYLALRRKS